MCLTRALTTALASSLVQWSKLSSNKMWIEEYKAGLVRWFGEGLISGGDGVLCGTAVDDAVAAVR